MKALRSGLSVEGGIAVANEVERIEKSLNNLKSMSKWVSRIFLVFFVLYCVLCLCFIGLFIFAQINSDFEGSFLDGLTMVILVVDLVILGGALLMLRNIFDTISQGGSPFTLRQSRQLMVIGILFALDVVLNFCLSPAFSSIVYVGPVEFGYGANHTTPYPVLTINVKSVVGTVVCFALSAVWRYGALLQSETDDLF